MVTPCMTVDNMQIDELLHNQKNFIKLISSRVFMNSLCLAIGDFIDLKTLLTLLFVEQCSVQQLAEYYHVKPAIIDDWITKIYRIIIALMRKNMIRFDEE